MLLPPDLEHGGGRWPYLRDVGVAGSPQMSGHDEGTSLRATACLLLKTAQNTGLLSLFHARGLRPTI